MARAEPDPQDLAAYLRRMMSGGGVRERLYDEPELPPGEAGDLMYGVPPLPEGESEPAVQLAAGEGVWRGLLGAGAKAGAKAGEKLPVGGIVQDIGQGTKVIPPPSTTDAVHVSPVWIDEITPEGIIKHEGKGEGAQVYGRGLYHAQDPGVQEHYYRQFTRKAPMRWEGKPVDEAPADIREIIRDLPHTYKPGDTSEQAVARRIQEMREQAGFMQRGEVHGDPHRRVQYDPQDIAAYLRDADRLEKIDPSRLELPRAWRHQTRIGAGKDEMLNWDKPWTMQPDVMQAVPKEFRADIERMLKLRHDADTRRARYFDPRAEAPEPPTGEDVYRMLGKRMVEEGDSSALAASIPGAPGATSALESGGIKGIVYKDADSRPRMEAWEITPKLEEAQQRAARARNSLELKGAQRDVDTFKKMLADTEKNPPSHNIVSFPNTPVDILKRWGIAPGAAIPPGLIEYLRQRESEQTDFH